jgi:hypothetical protein
MPEPALDEPGWVDSTAEFKTPALDEPGWVDSTAEFKTPTLDEPGWVDSTAEFKTPSPDTSFGGALKQAVDQPLEAIGTTFNVLGIPGGKLLQDAVDAPLNYQSASQRFIQPEEGDTTVFGFAPSQLPRALVEQAGQLGGSLLSRVAGVASGRAIGAALGGPVGGIAGGATGAFAGPFLFGAMQIAGPTAMERAKRNGRTEPNAEDISAALATAAVSGSLDAVGARFLPGGKGAVGPFVEKFAKAFFGEQVTESAQSLVEQFGESAGTDTGMEVSGRQAIGEGFLGAGAAGVATVASAPFTQSPTPQTADIDTQLEQPDGITEESVDGALAEMLGMPPITPEMRRARITPPPTPPTNEEAEAESLPTVPPPAGDVQLPEAEVAAPITPSPKPVKITGAGEFTLYRGIRGQQDASRPQYWSRRQDAAEAFSDGDVTEQKITLRNPKLTNNPDDYVGMTKAQAEALRQQGYDAVVYKNGDAVVLLEQPAPAEPIPQPAIEAVEQPPPPQPEQTPATVGAEPPVAAPAKGKPVEQMAPEAKQWNFSTPDERTRLLRLARQSPDDAIAETKQRWKGDKLSARTWLNELNVSHPLAAKLAVFRGEPVSAAAVEAYGIKLPEGWTQRGDLWHPPEAKPAAQAPARGATETYESPKTYKAAVVDVAPIRELEKATRTLYHASKGELPALTPREINGYNSMGAWLTSSKAAARELYGDVVHQAEIGELNLLEGGKVGTVNETIGRNAPLIEKHFGKAKADHMRSHPYNGKRHWELRKKDNTGDGLRGPEIQELKDLTKSADIHREALKSPAYVADFRAMLEKSGYDGIVWRESNADAPKSGPHDVYLVFNKADIPLRRVAEAKPTPAPSPAPAAAKEAAPAKPEAAQEESEYVGGPGAMGPVEAAEMQEGGKTTGLKKAVVKDERLQRGLDDLPPAERQSEEERVQRAEDAVDADETLAPKLISRIVDDGVTAISPDDAAVLLVERTRLMNERTTWTEAMQDNPQEAKAKLDDIERQMERLDVAQRRAGSAWGRTGRMYQRLMREDYTLEAMEQRARAAKGSPLTEDERAKIAEQAAAIKRLQEQLAELDKQATEANQKAERTAILEATIADLQKAEADRPKYSGRVLEYAEKVVGAIETRADAARIRLRQRLGRTSAGIDPTIVIDVAEIIVAKIARFGLNFTETSAALIAEMGNDIHPYLQKAWVKAQQLFDKDLAVKPKPVRDAVKEGVAKPKKGEKKPEDVGARAKAEAAAGMELGNKTAYEAVRAVINSGVKGETAIMKAAHDLLKPAYPDLTPGELDIAFSEYGKAKYPSDDAVKVELSKLRRLRQMQAAIDDVKKRGETARSGLQRAKADADVRKRQAELKAAIEEFGKDTPASPEQLANRERARLSRAQNAIEDLDRELRSGEAKIKARPSMPSAELEQLQSELNAMRELKREIEAAKNPPPPDHEVELKRLQDRADILRDRLARMELTQPKREGKPTADTVEIAAAKAEIKTLTETMAELRKPIPPSPAQKALDAALVARERAAQALDDISTGTAKHAALTKEAMTQLEEDIRLETDALKQLAAEMRRDAKPKADPEYAKEQSRIKALESAIERYQSRTAAADFSAAPKVHGPDTARVAALKEIRDSRKAAYDAAKRADMPVMTPEERYNATRIKQVDKQIAALEKRIKDRDFGPRVKPPKQAKTNALEAKEAELAALRAEVDKQTYLMALKNAPLHAKIWRGVQMTRGAFVNILSSLDFSGPRQALTTILANTTRLITNPARGTKMLYNPTAAMFRSWSSETRARRMDVRRKNRPNAKSGAYDLMGIEFSSLDTNTFTKFEENAHSILDEWADLPFKTGNTAKTVATAIPKAAAKAVRMSNRAFITFLNETRAELADELLRINYKDRPPTVNDLKIIGNLVNISTGRGSMKPITARVSAEALWAPKLLASRVQLLTGQPIWTRKGDFKGSARARMIVAKEYARMIAGGYLLYTVSQMFSDKDEDDPRSSDFGKIVRGNVRIDPWGGLSQVVIAASRVATASTKKLDGEMMDIGGERKYGVRGSWYLLADFLRSKVRPDIGAVITALDQKDFKGRALSLQERLANFVPIPLPLSDIAGIMRERGFTEGMILEALQQFGAGIQRYEDDSQEKPRR